MGWICPDCGRTFGHANQPHSCHHLPELDQWLAKRSELVRTAVTAVRSWLADYDDVLFEPVKSAVMVKRTRTFAEVQSKRTGAIVAFIVPREVNDPRIVHRLAITPTRTAYAVAVTDPAELDDQLRDWVLAAYDASPTG